MISREEIDNLANLARLELDEAQKVSLAKDLGDILGYVDKLKEAGDLAEVGNDPDNFLINVMRPDVGAHEPEQFSKTLIEATPKHNERYVRVKKIL